MTFSRGLDFFAVIPKTPNTVTFSISTVAWNYLTFARMKIIDIDDKADDSKILETAESEVRQSKCVRYIMTANIIKVQDQA